MADADINHRVGAALLQLAELKQAATGDVVTAKEEVESINRELTRATALAATIEAGTTAFVADVERRCKALDRFIATDPNDRDDVLLDTLLQMPKLPTYTYAQTESSRSSSETPAAHSVEQVAPSRSAPRHPRKSLHADNLTQLDKPYHHEYLNACPCVIYDGDEQEWIELRCAICGTNCGQTRRNRTYLAGATAMISHMGQMHPPLPTKRTVGDVVRDCRYRAVPREELERIMSGEMVIPLRSSNDATAVPPSTLITDPPAFTEPATYRSSQARARLHRELKRKSLAESDIGDDDEDDSELPAAKRSRADDVSALFHPRRNE
ncbi:hypothetical protein CB0940_06963 [Cercospora beticola]|uniref:Uncharacterized protein n=1 Tax=Cercospora beticola TaxID=122368 RepID=A0A2G5H9W4_CERBT|nr:hypothetical protein CB0940_06963 [Cercospora beticola]PIA89330.1 hypothetical protein CB0940_06963 [Cercospora beticola]WPB02881.1 hypothetical protein RHO25_007517 [Cercospora beticola]